MSSAHSCSPERNELSQSLQPINFIPKDQKVLRVSVRKIQVIRTTVEVFQPQTYYITSTGVPQSLRQPSDGYFRIGRQQITENGQRPNDLMLPPSDRAISRSHCMLYYDPFFDKTPPVN